MRTLLIFLFVAIVTLVVYNPTMDDFKAYLEFETEKRERELAMDNVVGRMLTGEQISMNTSAMGRSTERNNFFVFSTYTVMLNDEENVPYRWRYLGVGSFFFELESPPSAIDLHATPEG